MKLFVLFKLVLTIYLRLLFSGRQGYKKKLALILQDAGYILDASKKEQLRAAARSDSLLAAKGDGFLSLESCSEVM